MIYILDKSYQILDRVLNIMKEDKKWMLMTYYCPTHGDSARVEPIQLTREEISKNLFKKSKSKKNIKEL